MEHILSRGWNILPKEIKEIQDNVWKVETENGTFALKCSLLKEKNLRFICRAERSLPLRGFNKFAIPQNCTNGQPYFQKDQQCYTLHQWIDGEKCNFDRREHLFAAAATLGDFHLRSRDPSLHHISSSRSNCFVRGENIQKRIEEMHRFYELALCSPQTTFNRLYRSYYPHFIQKAAGAKQRLLYSEYPRLAAEAAAVGSFIHYDVAARNFIIQERNAFLIDFDYCCCDVPLTDLMRLIKRSLKQGRNAETKLEAILSGYQRHRKLTPAESEVLYALVLFPQKFWRISHRYFCEPEYREEKFCLKKLKAAAAELEREDQWLPLLKEKLEVSH